MRIYLAARYSRREELCGYADHLRAEGHAITSRWLAGSPQVSDDGLSAAASSALRQQFAGEDWEDLLSADACIAFSEAPRASNSRGGRHVELGAALALNKIVLVIGPLENVFMCLPQVFHFRNWQDFLDVRVLPLEEVSS